MTDTAAQPAAPARRARPTSKLGFGGSHLDAYFGEWAIAFRHGHALARQAERLNLRVHVAQQEQAAAGSAGPPQPSAASRFGEGYGEVLADDGTAVIRIQGTLMKFTGSMSAGTGTVAVRRMVRRAKADPGVLRVMLVVDSPGGTVAGTQELADDVEELAAAKPTHAYVEDLMCSAALWVGVQAGTVSASRTSLVGSIGTLMAAYDYSAAAKKAGIKVHVVTSAEAAAHKGAGLPGARITDEQLAEWRRVVNGLQAHFSAAVAHGRGLPPDAVAKLADGRIHLAEEARKLGLVDHVESFDEAMTRLRGTPAAKRRGPRADVVTVPAAGADPAGVPLSTDAGADAAAGDTQPAAASAKEHTMGKGNEKPDAAAEAVANKDEAKTDAPAKPVEARAAEPKQAATVAELKAACPGASSDFVLEQAVKGATLSEAKDAFLAHQGEQLKARDDELQKARAANDELAKQVAAAPRGNPAVSHSPDASGDEHAKRAAALGHKIGGNLGRFAASIRIAGRN